MYFVFERCLVKEIATLSQTQSYFYKLCIFYLYSWDFSFLYINSVVQCCQFWFLCITIFRHIEWFHSIIERSNTEDIKCNMFIIYFKYKSHSTYTCFIVL